MGIVTRSFLFNGKIDPEEAKASFRKANPGSMVQTIFFDVCKNARTLEVIAGQTLTAVDTGNLVARKPEIDFLLRIAGTTQIAEAIRKAGSTRGEPFVLVTSAKAKKLNVPAGLGGVPMKRRALDPEDYDMIERGALLNVERN